MSNRSSTSSASRRAARLPRGLAVHRLTRGCSCHVSGHAAICPLSSPRSLAATGRSVTCSSSSRQTGWLPSRDPAARARPGSRSVSPRSCSLTFRTARGCAIWRPWLTPYLWATLWRRGLESSALPRIDSELPANTCMSARCCLCSTTASTCLRRRLLSPVIYWLPVQGCASSRQAAWPSA